MLQVYRPSSENIIGSSRYRDSYRGEGDGGLPSPPLLNQHKCYSKVVLKHKQQQSDNCCSKRYATVQKHLEFFPKVYSSCQSIGKRHCFLAGGGRQMIPPPFRKILYETLRYSVNIGDGLSFGQVESLSMLAV